MEPLTIYQVSGQDFKQAIQEAISDEVEQKIYNRFEAVFVDSNTVCDILSITKVTLYKYVKAGIIQHEDRQGRSEYKFRLSDILRIDLAEARRKLRYSLNNQSL